jgi:hypothetical protein
MGRGEVNAGLWWRNLKERDHLEDPGVDRMIILKWIFRKLDVEDVCVCVCDVGLVTGECV